MLRHLRWWIPLVGGIIGLMIGALLLPVMIFLQPQRYHSSAVVEIKHPPSLLRVDGKPLFDHARFLGEEMTRFKSNEVLGKTVDVLDLGKVWSVGKEQAIETLRESTEIERIKGTDLLSIGVSLTNKEDSDRVLDSLIRTYQEIRRREEIRRSDAALGELHAAFQKQEALVEEKEKLVKQLTGTARNLAERDVEIDLEIREKQKSTLEQSVRAIGESTLVVHDNPSISLPSPLRLGKLGWIVVAFAGMFVIGSIPLMGWRSARERSRRNA